MKAVVFDLIGVIFKERSNIARLTEFLPKNLPYEKVKEKYFEWDLGKINREDFWNFLGVNNYKNLQQRFLDSLTLNKDIFEITDYLKKKGYKTAILSNFVEDWANYMIEKYKFDKIFDALIFSGFYKIRKPDPKIYKILFEKLKLKPEDCFYIDDRLMMLVNANKLGMKTIYFRLKNEEEDFVPDFEIESLKEIKKIIL